jgi:hypothetical protein
MHPEVVAAEPRACPICGMALEPRKPGAPAAAMARGSMDSMNGDVEAVENVRKHNVIDFVRRRSLLPHTQDIRGAAWVADDDSIVGVFYDDQIDAMADDERAAFSSTSSPDITVAVRRVPGAPEVCDGSTSRVRFRLDSAAQRAVNGQSAVEPGEVGWLEIAARARAVLAVPASAVLQSREGPYVLAWKGLGYQFEKRRIEVGEIFMKYGFAVVLSGLRPNERVVTRATFFLDAERRLASRGAEGTL